jgi:hypothetical protein
LWLSLLFCANDIVTDIRANICVHYLGGEPGINTGFSTSATLAGSANYC